MELDIIVIGYIIQLMLFYDDEILYGMNLIIKFVNKQFCFFFICQEFEGLQDVMRCRVVEYIGKLDWNNQNYLYCINFIIIRQYQLNDIFNCYNVQFCVIFWEYKRYIYLDLLNIFVFVLYLLVFL